MELIVPMSMLVLTLGFLVVAGIFSYVFLMIFYPEWVGITGKTAKKNMEDHKEGNKAEEMPFFSDIKK